MTTALWIIAVCYVTRSVPVLIREAVDARRTIRHKLSQRRLRRAIKRGEDPWGNDPPF